MLQQLRYTFHLFAPPDPFLPPAGHGQLGSWNPCSYRVNSSRTWRRTQGVCETVLKEAIGWAIAVGLCPRKALAQLLQARSEGCLAFFFRLERQNSCASTVGTSQSQSQLPPSTSLCLSRWLVPGAAPVESLSVLLTKTPVSIGI